MEEVECGVVEKSGIGSGPYGCGELTHSMSRIRRIFDGTDVGWRTPNSGDTGGKGDTGLAHWYDVTVRALSSIADECALSRKECHRRSAVFGLGGLSHSISRNALNLFNLILEHADDVMSAEDCKRLSV
jgi:hypothetical protein